MFVVFVSVLRTQLLLFNSLRIQFCQL